MTGSIFDSRLCRLGEGALWHPLRRTLFWFDIKGQRMLARGAGGQQEWVFDEMHSAAGWIDVDTLFIASETGLWRYSITDGARSRVCDLERHNAAVRSNDGRADPYGGFWIGTMGKNAEPAAGAIWRWFRGELRCLYARLSIPNAICFSPDKQFAHFSDTVTGRVMKVSLDADGWPAGEPSVFLDLSSEQLNPDGAVMDGNGVLHVAQWGAGRVASYDRNGLFVGSATFPAKQVSCPAFGGEDFRTLFCTSAYDGLHAPQSHAGMTFSAKSSFTGLAEHCVIMPEKKSDPI